MNCSWNCCMQIGNNGFDIHLFQAQALWQHITNGAGLCHNCSPGWPAGTSQWAVSPCTCYVMEHLCLHHPGNRYETVCVFTFSLFVIMLLHFALLIYCFPFFSLPICYAIVFMMSSFFGNITSSFLITFFNLMCFCVPASENMLVEEGKALFGSLQSRQVCQASSHVLQHEWWASVCVCQCLIWTALLQLAGLKAVVQFSAAQRLRSSQVMIQKQFTNMLAGMW